MKCIGIGMERINKMPEWAFLFRYLQFQLTCTRTVTAHAITLEFVLLNEMLER